MARRSRPTTRTVEIDVHGATWKVPFGFGRAYRDSAKAWHPAICKPGKEVAILRDIMNLVGYDAPLETIIEWDLRKRVELLVYCANVHARAGDNICPRHPPLAWLPEPWTGPRQGKGVFEGPGPMVLT